MEYPHKTANAKSSGIKSEFLANQVHFFTHFLPFFTTHKSIFKTIHQLDW